MQNSTKYFIFIFTRNFLPMSPYITPYLLDKKNISQKNLLSKITHKLFITTIFTALITPFIIELIGKRMICIIDNILELIVYLIILFMPKNNLFLCEFAGILHGINKSLETIGKSIMYDDNSSNNSKYAKYTLFKQSACTLAAITGQEFYTLTNNYSISLFISAFFILISLFISIFFLEDLNSKKNIFLDLKNELNSKIILFCTFYIIGTTLLIGLSVYSSYIFLERKNEIDFLSNFFGKIFYYFFSPIRFLFYIFTKLFYKKVCLKFNENTILFGYVNALFRLVSFIPKYYIINQEYTFETRISILIVFIICTIVLLILIYKVKNLFYSYIFTILGFFFAFTILGVSNNGFAGFSKNYKLYSANLFFSAIIHAIVSYYSMNKNDGTAKRLIYYCVIDGVLLIGCILAIFLIRNNVI